MPIILFTLLCGIAAAILRGFQLANSFEPETQLIPPGDPLTIAMMVLSALFVAGIAVCAFTAAKKEQPRKPLGDAWLILELAALAALFTASAYDVYVGIADFRISLLCLGILGLFSGAALLYIALSINKLKFTSATGFWATVPVFWACFMLIVEFWGQAGNPVRSAFLYGMLAAVFCTLALYAAAGFFFKRVKPGWALFYTLSGAFFAVVTLGGSLFARYVLRPDGLADAAVLSLSSMMQLAFIALHMIALAAVVLRGLMVPPPEEEAIEETPPELPDAGAQEEGI